MTVRSEPQQARSRDKRDRILAATLALLRETPAEEIGTKLIADRAEVSIGSLYRFFPDREAIYEALLITWLDRFVTVMDELTADPPPTAEAFVGRVVRAYAHLWRTEPGYRRISPSALRSAPFAGRDNDEMLADRLHRVLTGHYGQEDADTPRARLLMAITVAEFLLNQAFAVDPEGDSRVLEELEVLLRRYLITHER
jgi:AcrR family transcriptional regulator